MTLVLHPLARTTPRTRALLRAEDPALSDHVLAQRYGVTAPTVRKGTSKNLPAIVSSASAPHRAQHR